MNTTSESPAGTEDTFLFTGKSFRIRETRIADLASWYKWFNDPAVTRELIHGVIPNTIEAQARFRERNLDGANGKIIFSIVDRDRDLLIGTCSINIHGPWLHGRGEISLVLGETAFQKGSLYLEITAWQLDHAFLKMNLHSVFSATSENNKAVINTLERLGFKQAGIMREVSYRDGKYVSGVVHDILRQEWLALRGLS